MARALDATKAEREFEIGISRLAFHLRSLAKTRAPARLPLNAPHQTRRGPIKCLTEAVAVVVVVEEGVEGLVDGEEVCCYNFVLLRTLVLN